MSEAIVAADIGGTHARFALAEVGEGRVVSLGDPVTLRTEDYSGLAAAWDEFGRRTGTLPDAAAIAVAGVGDGEQLSLTNGSWTIGRSLLAQELGVERLALINDFGAVAHAVAQLGEEHFVTLCGPERSSGDGVTSIVGPGTGLGVAQLIRTAAGDHVVETEGGHIDFAPLDPVEDRLLAELRSRYGRVSVERVLCGRGLAEIHATLAGMSGTPVARLDERQLWTAALERTDALASAALDRFCLSLGSVAGDLALAHGSDAVVIAGGLGLRLKDRLRASGLAGRFVAKGRFRGRMEAIGVRLITHPQPGLFGAAAAFARRYN